MIAPRSTRIRAMPLGALPMLRCLGLALLVAAVLAPATAEAGRRPFMWVWDTETLPERGAELEMWVTDRVHKTNKDNTSLWWSPILGVTDTVELALPVEIFHWQKTGLTQVEWFGAEVRWRLDDPDPIEAGKFVPLVRAGVQRLVRDRDSLQFEADVVLAWDPLERLHLVLNAGGRTDIAMQNYLGVYALGASWRANETLRFGAEVFGEYVLATTRKHNSFVMAGPDLGWTHGRTWLTLGWQVGLDEAAPRGMGRLLWGIAW